jgi:hypothetical protein
MALRGTDVAGAAVPMLVVVPVREVGSPGARLLKDTGRVVCAGDPAYSTMVQSKSGKALDICAGLM